MSKGILQIVGKPAQRKCVVLHAAELYRDKAFMTWLNKGTGTGVATWHTLGAAGCYSDVFIHVALPYDGSDSNMPKHCWRAILDALKRAGFEEHEEVLVWLQNMESL